MTRHRIFGTTFASIYPLYVAKVQRKGRDPQDVDRVICWLTGHDPAGLQEAVASGVDLETFFAQAPAVNPRAAEITGVICGHRVEEIEDPLMQRIRWMDKLVDEVARGKRMTSVLRGSADGTPPAGSSTVGGSTVGGSTAGGSTTGSSPRRRVAGSAGAGT